MQKGIAYGQLLQKSCTEWKQVWGKVLLIQILGNILSVLIFGILCSIEIIMLVLLGYNILGYTGSLADVTLPQLLTFWRTVLQTSGMLFILVCIVINVVIILGINAFARSIIINWFHDSVKGKKIGFHQIRVYGKKFWNVLWKVEVIKGATIVIPLVVVIGVVKNIVQKAGWNGIAIALVIIIIGYILFAALTWIYVLFFMHPLLTEMKKVPSVSELLQTSWQFAKKNGLVFVVTFCLLIAIAMTVSLVLFSIETMITLPFILLKSSIILAILEVCRQIVGMLANMLRATYSWLFVFNVCYAKK